MSPAEVEKLWRACGLMEAFLGNSGSNHRLYAFAAAIERETLARAAEAYEAHDRTGRDWVAGSLWDTINREAAARVRALAGKAGEA